MGKKKYYKNNYNSDFYDRFGIISKFRNANRNHHLSEALSYINDYSSVYGNDPYFKHEVAKYYYNKGEYLIAIKTYSEIINNNSDNMYYSHYELAKCYRAIGEFDKAVDSLKKIISSNHKDKGPACYLLGKVYSSMGNSRDAIATLNDQINNEDIKYDVNCVIQLSRMYLLIKDERKAIDILKRINLDDASDMDKYRLALQKVRIYCKFNNVFEAKHVLDTEVRPLKCRDYGYYFAQASILHSEGDYDLAIEKINSVLKKIPFGFDIFNIMLLLVSCYRKLGFPEKALEVYNDAKEKLTDSQMIDDESKFSYELVKIQEAFGNYDEAFKILEENINNFGEYRSALLIDLSSYYVKKGQFEKIPFVINELEKNVLDTNEKKELERIKAYMNKYMKTNYELDTLNLGVSSIINYDFDKVKEHIEVHKNETKGLSFFNPDVDISELMILVEEKLKNMEPISCSLLDTYYVRVPNIGKYKLANTSTLKVIATCDEKKIITMYPFKNILATEKIVVNKENKSKRLSQIEKFNARYKL